MTAYRRATAVSAVLVCGVVLLAHRSWDAARRLEALGVQQVQSLDGEWEVPNTFSDDEQEVASGAKALNQGHVNWYFIPPKPSVPSLPARRLDASGAVAGDPNSPKWGMSPLVLDHVFTEDKTGKQAWANVHAFDHGELLTGQMRLVHKKRYVPPPPPPEKDVDLDGVLHGVLDEAIASAFAKVMSEPPSPSPPPPPQPSEIEDAPLEDSEGDVGRKKRKKLEPITNAPTHLPWESDNIEKGLLHTTAPVQVETTPVPTMPPPAVSEEEVATDIAEIAEEKESKEEDDVKEKEESPQESIMECSSSIYSENGCCCQIPFEYGDVSHTNCTLMDHTSFWCYTQDKECGKKERATGKYWDNCWPAPATKQKTKPPRIFKRKHHKKQPPGRQCGREGHHNGYNGPWHPWNYNRQCNDDEVCNYQCKTTQCRGCSGGNCKCVPIKSKGQTCGDGTRRGPTFSHSECDTGKCAYNCNLCFNCDGGNCLCVQTEHIRGT